MCWKFLEGTKTVYVRILGTDDPSEISLVLIIKQTRHGFQTKGTRMFSIITNLSNDYSTVNYCLVYSKTLA